MEAVSFEKMREIYTHCFTKLKNKVDSFEQVKLTYVFKYLNEVPELESQICYDDSPCTEQITYFRNRLSLFKMWVLKCGLYKGSARISDEISEFEESINKFETLKKCQLQKNANSLMFDSPFDQEIDYYQIDECESLFKEIIIKITHLEMQMPLVPLTDPETCREICYDLYEEAVNGHYERNNGLKESVKVKSHSL